MPVGTTDAPRTRPWSARQSPDSRGSARARHASSSISSAAVRPARRCSFSSSRTKAAAPILKKLIESAVANAKTQSPGVDVDALFVETAFVDKAPNKHMRRWRPRAMGRATRVQKGLSHITVILAER